MSVRAPERPEELESESELDLGRIRGALAARWWMLVVGVIAGALIGYLVSLGGGGHYSAQAIVFLGQPLSPSGTSPVQTLASNPTSIDEVVHAEANISRVAQSTGLSETRLRTSVVTQAIGGSLSRLGASRLIAVSVEGGPPAKIVRAANEFAHIVVVAVSSYTGTKIVGLKSQIASDNSEISSIDERLRAYDAALQGASLTEKLVILTQAGLAEQRRGIVEQDLTQSRDLLSLAQNVEASRIVIPAAAVKSPGRSHRNAVLIGAVLGLLVALLAVLFWEPLTRLARRPAA